MAEDSNQSSVQEPNITVYRQDDDKDAFCKIKSVLPSAKNTNLKFTANNDCTGVPFIACKEYDVLASSPTKQKRCVCMILKLTT